MGMNHNNFVSTLIDLPVETKLVSFIIICTIFTLACFMLNNVNAQLDGVSNNLFGNSTQQSTNQSAQPFLGINMRGYYTNMPQSREDFKALSQTITMKAASKLSQKHMPLTICVIESIGNHTQGILPLL